MLEQITDEGMVHWHCRLIDRKGRLKSCGQERSAHISEAEYMMLPEQETGRGAVIALPRCECGARYFLKADYSLEELYDELQGVTDAETGVLAYVLPLRYMYNLQAHWLLYNLGKAEHAPVLEMPPQALLEYPSFATAKPGTVYALWFGYSTVRAYRPYELANEQAVLLLEEA